MSDAVYRVWTDGACRGNPGPASIGVVVLDPDGTEIATASRAIGRTTNNVAEYEALLVALELLEELSITRAEFNMDSQLIVRQLSGQYRVKDPKMKRMHQRVRVAMARLEHSQVHHVPREENKRADALANEALDAL